jgi:hypothetical protein
MPGVGGQFRSLAIIRSKDVDLGREIGGGPPGAKFDLTEVLPVTGGPPAAGKVASAARSCAIAWSNELDLGIERLRGSAPSACVSLRSVDDGPGAVAAAWTLVSLALAGRSRAIAAVA